MEWVPGRIPALECLRVGRRVAHRLLVQQGAKGLEALRAAASGVRTQEVPRSELDRLFPEGAHQGVLLEADPLPVHRGDEWARRPLPDDAAILILDSIEDPHNFGAMVRSAAACGVHAVVFGKDRAAPLSPIAVKSAAGGMEHVHLVEAVNLVRCIEILRDAGCWVAELDERASQTIWEADFRGRIAIVIGNEGKGVRRLVRERCDFHLRIPLPGPISSLNASVSAGIALAECLRQRRVADLGCRKRE